MFFLFFLSFKSVLEMFLGDILRMLRVILFGIKRLFLVSFVRMLRFM